MAREGKRGQLWSSHRDQRGSGPRQPRVLESHFFSKKALPPEGPTILENTCSSWQARVQIQSTFNHKSCIWYRKPRKTGDQVGSKMIMMGIGAGAGE